MDRPFFLSKIQAQFEVHPACAILGPRQAGKTTLARMYAEKFYAGKAHFFDLENSADLIRLENPMLAFSLVQEDLIVIDEIQRRPDLFPTLRVIIDQPGRRHKFLILGSASRDLIQQSSETLAGRIGYVELPPFSLFEVKESLKLWLRGGYPSSYLAPSDKASLLWRQSYITTFLERDMPMLGFSVPAEQMRRFWMMIAHYHGQTFNASEVGKSLQVSSPTARRYLDILAGTFMVRILPPWFENISKRQVKAPKLYFRDSGILNALVGVEEHNELVTYPKLGAFWEGFALEELIRVFDAAPGECYFWSTLSGAELDLLIIKSGKRIGFEVKYTEAPRITKSMHVALEDLDLDHLIIVCPGDQTYPLDVSITVHGLSTLGITEAQNILQGKKGSKKA